MRGTVHRVLSQVMRRFYFSSKTNLGIQDSHWGSLRQASISAFARIEKYCLKMHVAMHDASSVLHAVAKYAQYVWVQLPVRVHNGSSIQESLMSLCRSLY